MRRLLTWKFWLRALGVCLLGLVLLFGIAIGLVYWKQAALVQYALKEMNQQFVGELTIEGSHIAFWETFPYISIDLEQLKIHEDKTRDCTPIVAVQDAYVGFDFWKLWAGNYDIKTIKLKKGDLNLIQHLDGNFNITNALASPEIAPDTPQDSAAAPLDMHLQSIVLEDVDIHKINEATNIEVELFVHKAKTKFSTVGDHLHINLNSKFELNLIVEKDTVPYIRHKHFELQTEFDYYGEEQVLRVQPSEVKLEEALFAMEGSVDLDDELNLDLSFKGSKPNFDLFIAFAPEELIPTLKSYGNKGQVFFEADIKGKSANGQMPLIEARFGCDQGSIENFSTRKTLRDMAFRGFFTNGAARHTSTMEFKLSNFQAKPDAGIFSGDLRVFNFDSPEIDLKLRSEFNLEFLAKFFNLKNLEDMYGKIALTMNFRDIIDLEHPERSIEKLNESYYTELQVDSLGFRSTNYYLPVKNINIRAVMEGHEAKIEYLNAELGNSDIAIKGTISDLPAILHHTDDQVKTSLTIESKLLDLAQMTFNDSLGKSKVDEQISDLSLDLAFVSSAKAFTESKNLPVGEFMIRDFHATFKHYPHRLHDFHADVFIQDEDVRLVDFSGEIDGSDFHFTGRVEHYDIWLREALWGDCNIEFDLTSKHLRLEDLFSYGGENYVPEDYRHEDFQNLRLHGRVALHFKEKGLHSADMYLDQLSAKMQVHKARFERFKGRIHYEDEHLIVEALDGQIGHSDLHLYVNYYLGKDPAIRKRDNFFSIRSRWLDLDELFAYNPPPGGVQKPEDHDAGFNIFELPFTDMRLEADIKKLNYHRYLLNDLQTRMRITKNHYVYIDTCSFRAAGGYVDFKGYFNGADPKHIYFSPDMTLEQIDLDKLLFKFENFGQDHLVSENLHGQLTCNVKGKILMHADLTPIIDQSDLTLVVEIVNGRLENFAPVMALSEYFQDKNLSKVFFDTLSNEFELKQGKMIIPWMTINSSIGFLELTGEQDLDMNMLYYFKIPLQLVTQVGFQKLFKRKREEVDLDKEDEIQYRDPAKKTRYINLKFEGNAETYSISLGRDKREKKRQRQLRRQARRERRRAG